MIGLRPATQALYIGRRRLLEQLPDAPGYVVWLEAPYGYGKSVLAMQWAEALEEAGWRIAWLALAGRDARAALAELLSLPADAPWNAVLDALWRQPTLLVLEDLAGSEALTPVLRRLGGLVLLASRGPLTDPELPRLVTEGRLVQLGADQLAFTLPEAEQLFSHGEKAHDIWARTSGWPLPLHFASLTGSEPDHKALLAGVRGTLSEAEWQELLLLAAVGLLPREAATPTTERLAHLGFVQGLETNVRLHPLVAETAIEAHPDEVRAAVTASAQRLTPSLRAVAFERAGLLAELGELLEDVDAALDRHDPAAVIRWHQLAPLPAGPVRYLTVGCSMCLTDQPEEGLRHLGLAADAAAESADVTMRLAVLGNAGWFLAQHGRLEEARQRAAEGEALLDLADPERAGRFLNNISVIDYLAGEYGRAAAAVERALPYYPPDSRLRSGPLSNLAILHWNINGDLDRRVALQSEAIALGRVHNKDALPVLHRDLMRIHIYLGEREAALEHGRAGQEAAGNNPRVAIELRALEAMVLGEPERFATLLAEARVWEDGYTIDVVTAAWLKTLRLRGDLAGARKALAVATENAAGAQAQLSAAPPTQPGAGVPTHLGAAAQAAPSSAALEQLGGFTKTELAIIEALSGDRAAAKELLQGAREAYRQRDFRMAWQAAAYLIGRQEGDLDALLELTLVGPRILPGLVPLDSLPRDRPELARSYPISQLLASGWKAAISARLDDIPPLEIDVLGGFSVRVLGAEVELTLKSRQILALLLMRQDRDAIGATLWPDTSTEKVRNNLSVHLNMLRKVIEPWRVATYLYEEGLKRTRSDLWELESHLATGDAEALLALYRPPFAQGVYLPAVTEEDSRLRESVIGALKEAAASAKPEAAQRYLERVLELDALDEEALQGLLEHLVRRGRNQEARRRYGEFAARLRAELGLDPLEETAALITP